MELTQDQYLVRFKQVCDELYEMTNRKNRDYADPNDAFLNFRQIEQLTAKRISTEMGILTRMSDKMSRIAALLSRDAKVSTESITDTLTDLAVYSIILRLYLENLNT